MSAAGGAASAAAQGRDDFPYQREFLPSPQAMLQALRDELPRVVYGKTGPKFRGVRTMVEAEPYSFYLRATALSDHYAEEERVRARRGGDPSPHEYWTRHRARVAAAARRGLPAGREPTTRELRDALYGLCKEANQFLPSRVRGVLTALYGERLPAGLRMLDISAGWGDRLVAAIAYGYDYTGFDPNTRMRPVYARIIAELGDAARQRVETLPFEDAQLDEAYDVCLSSPPFFAYEVYSDEATQSSQRYPGLDRWLHGFLYRALDKAWGALRRGGYLAIHMADTPGADVTARMLDYMQKAGRAYEGAIGMGRQRGGFIPVHVWRK